MPAATTKRRIRRPPQTNSCGARRGLIRGWNRLPAPSPLLLLYRLHGPVERRDAEGLPVFENRNPRRREERAAKLSSVPKFKRCTRARYQKRQEYASLQKESVPAACDPARPAQLQSAP